MLCLHVVSTTSPVTDPGSTMLTVAEVAAALRVDAFTVRRWIGRRELPAILLGRSYRVEPAALAAFVDARRTTA